LGPNVLLVMVDAFPADRVWGPDRGCVTPFLDNLVPLDQLHEGLLNMLAATEVRATRRRLQSPNRNVLGRSEKGEEANRARTVMAHGVSTANGGR
jgi:hypothetical protein